MKLCKRCVNPDTRPNIQFNEDGLCPVCQFTLASQNNAINWSRRREELNIICEWGKQNTSTTYDCIVTVSGGKDSLRQACYARDTLKMNPLLVSCTYPPEQVTDRGTYNLANLINLGFDTISVGPDPLLWKRLMRLGLFDFGAWTKATEMALYAIPVHVAIAYQIPLLFYGENPVWTIGEKHGHVDGNANQIKQCNTIKGGPNQILPTDVKQQDAHFYFYPTDEEMQAAQLRLVYLGYYMKDWSGKNNAEFAMARGMQVRNDPPEKIGDIWGFSCLDEDYSIVNQYLKYMKYGFGRANDQVCEAINSGLMTREEGLKLLKKCDGKCDISLIQRFCNYLEITEEQFFEVAENYRNKDVWRQDCYNQWHLKCEELE